MDYKMNDTLVTKYYLLFSCDKIPQIQDFIVWIDTGARLIST